MSTNLISNPSFENLTSGWADFIDRRFDIDNCRTLCTQCHYLITFGKPMPCSVTAWGHNLMKGGEGI